MTLLYLLINQIGIMFIMMAIGYAFYKIKFISDQGSADISKILLYLVIPVVVVKNFMIERSAENVQILIDATIISAVAMGISMLVAHIFYGKNGVANFATTFSNAGFIGIPLISATLGEEAVIYISIMIVLINLLQWTYGVYTIAGDKSVMNPAKVIKNPIVISVVIGLALFFLEIEMPSFVTTIFTNIANVNTPLAMILSGVYLAQTNLLGMIKKKDNYMVSLVRLIIIPLITMIVFKFLPFGNETIKLAILIAAACPVGSNVAIFASAYNKDYKAAVEYVCMSTVGCLITLIAVVYVASMVL